ncbi:MAG: hypothetical protein J6X59_07540 [Bacteroidales bacterium]|nr:hypothetical protein [Bacteroidales bacterium]
MDIKKILKIKGLKYWVATAVFVIVLLFVDTYNLLVTIRLNHEVNNLEDSIVKIEAAINREKDNKKSISSIDDKERLAREEYMMKRPDEDIYTRRTENAEQ